MPLTITVKTTLPTSKIDQAAAKTNNTDTTVFEKNCSTKNGSTKNGSSKNQTENQSNTDAVEITTTPNTDAATGISTDGSKNTHPTRPVDSNEKREKHRTGCESTQTPRTNTTTTPQ